MTFNNITTLNQDVDTLIDGIPVSALKAGAFDVVFVQFNVGSPTLNIGDASGPEGNAEHHQLLATGHADDLRPPVRSP